MIQAFSMAFKSISGNKMRSFLTMLGIIIGVMALVILVSLVNGATSTVTDTIASLATDLVTVTVSDDQGVPVTLAETQTWAQDSDIGLIAPYASQNFTASHDKTEESVTVYGITSQYLPVQNLTLSLGRNLLAADVDQHSYVCILSSSAAEELIGYQDCLGETVTLSGIPYTVIGVLAEDEDSITASLMGEDLSVYLPYTSLVRLSTSLPLGVTSFVASAPEGGTMEATEAALTALLYERFHGDDEAYTLSSQDIMEDTMSSITSILSILLGGIAAISLIVGGIGIMNIMLVTVTERTREIGIRKAIGASRGAILSQFLLEAVVLCMLGCAIGIFVSWCILRVVSLVVSSLSMTFVMDPTVVLVSVAFCLAIGIIFGLYPANKAARMKPIDALHHAG